MRAVIAIGLVLTVAAAGCTGSSENTAPTTQPATTAGSAAPETTQATTSPSTAETTTIAPPTIVPDADVVRLAPASPTQPFALRFGTDPFGLPPTPGSTARSSKEPLPTPPTPT